MAATAAMAPPADARALRKRLVSAAILLPLALVNVWLGDPYWGALVCLFALVMGWEWMRMCIGPAGGPALGIDRAGLLGMGALGVGVLLAATGRYSSAMALLAFGGAAVTWVAGRDVGQRRKPGGPIWQGFGVLYIGLPSAAILWVRASPEGGLPALLWMLALVVAVDSGAFAAGRLIGGPKLAPMISPNKTWAGLAVGIAAAILVGWLAGAIVGLPHRLPLIALSAGMAVVEQAGDLAESAFKRRFGVKDSGDLIPGHGGLLDRVDGVMIAILAVAAARLIHLEGWDA
ncbi:MAG: phosphatidate cytidylyltransferase [Gemmatimonadales bacterium]